MAIVKMDKFTLLFFESQKEKLLTALQGFESIQFINLQDQELLEKNEEFKNLKKDSVNVNLSDYNEQLSKIRFSLEFLKDYMPKQSALKSIQKEKASITIKNLQRFVENSNWFKIYKDLKEKEETIVALTNEIGKYETEIQVLDKWKNFDATFEALKNLKYTKAYLGTIQKNYEISFINDLSDSAKNTYVEILGKDSQDVFLHIIMEKNDEPLCEELFKKYGFSIFQPTYEGIPQNIIKEFFKEIKTAENKISHIKENLKSYEEQYEKLQYAFDYYNNLLMREEAATNFLKTEKVVAISGWIPSEEKNTFSSLIKSTVGEKFSIEYEEIKEEEFEDVPIKLKNRKFASNFEGIVEMYSLPKYNEIDPTPIMSIFYFIFFGMMLSDAGYGLLLLFGSLFMVKFTKDKEKAKTYKLFMLAGISTVIWGAIYGSWFGDLFSKYLGIDIPYLLDPGKSVTSILLISVAMGVVHIFVGLGIKGYIYIRDGKYLDAIYDVLTWYSTLIGAFLWIGTGMVGLPSVATTIGMILFIIGAIGLLLTQGREHPTIGARLGWGIYGVYGMTSYLGDIVSYSRLLALGLATGFIANAFNLIVALIPSPFSIVLSPVIFLLLHGFNMAVNALGSYVHAARLQYLEFFNKFYEGGGKKFTPYKLSDNYIKITK